MTSKDISLLEQWIMLAILRQHPNAYGVSIQDEIKQRTKKEYSFGSIYAALGRLQSAGYVDSREGEATNARGGRRKMYFEMNGVGRAALDHVLNATEAMRPAKTKEAAHAG